MSHDYDLLIDTIRKTDKDTSRKILDEILNPKITVKDISPELSLSKCEECRKKFDKWHEHRIAFYLEITNGVQSIKIYVESLSSLKDILSDQEIKIEGNRYFCNSKLHLIIGLNHISVLSSDEMIKTIIFEGSQIKNVRNQIYEIIKDFLQKKK